MDKRINAIFSLFFVIAFVSDFDLAFSKVNGFCVYLLVNLFDFIKFGFGLAVRAYDAVADHAAV